MSGGFTFRRDPFLARLAARLREAPHAIHQEMAKRLKLKLEAVIEQQFAQSKDPEGRPYLPPKDGHAPPMTRSGALRDGVEVEAVSTAEGVFLRVRVSVAYARYLQLGTYKMRPRHIVPALGVLSADWREACRDATQESIEFWYRGT